MDDQAMGTAYIGEMKLSEGQSSGSQTKLSDSQKQFVKEVKSGLRNAQKTLPCKYFYDQTGSELFEQICDLEEYYITRTELALLKSIENELAEMIGKNSVIIEPGAGAGIKIRRLLDALDLPQAYVPMDISEEFLFYSANIIQKQFPEIEILPIQGDFTQPVQWRGTEQHNNRVVFFPGSTIGNFEKQEAIEFLRNMRELIGDSGSLIVGADLLKEKEILEAAYDDKKGVTAKFNKNLLARINQELNGDFQLKHFTHEARLNNEQQRIEMHLVSDKQQTVTIDNETFKFSSGESIHTENSHKYSMQSFAKIAKEAGLKTVKTWTDKDKLFSIHYLVRQ
jgi:L-histidine Nalpha-methyltransferase